MSYDVLQGSRFFLFLLFLLSGGVVFISWAHGAESNESGSKPLLDFMQQYQTDYHRMHCEISYSWWDAMITGTPEAFEKSAEANLQMSEYHSSAEKFKSLKEKIAAAKNVDPLTARAARVAYRAFEESQFPPELMKKIILLSSEIEQIFQTQRAELEGKEYTNNELLERIENETDTEKRHEIWSALKQVGDLVAPKIVELALLRNEAAHHLGYKNYWEMSVAFQEYQPAQLSKIFEELEKETTPLFRAVKADLDLELCEKFKTDKIMPWHYDNPFFQQAPASRDLDANEFYRARSKEDIVQLSIDFYDSLGLDTRTILAKSDLYEKPGKSQHAFCNNMNGDGDVRVLCNIKPTAEWMDTQLHELGHAVYDLNIDPALPYNIREPSHIFTTEGIAMLFGALARDPQWLVNYAKVDPNRVKQVTNALHKQRLREQLIFCRWTLVMFHFERALYENPKQDLKTLWWDIVERYQLMPRPEGEVRSEWASKPHFVIAPVYYHNYMLGELFAAQVRKTLGSETKSDPKVFGQALLDKVFRPGNRYPWEEFVLQATGIPFSSVAYAEELSRLSELTGIGRTESTREQDNKKGCEK